MEREQKYVVEDRNGLLIGIFENLDEARSYVEQDVIDCKSGYERRDGFPQPNIIEDAWLSDSVYKLDIEDAWMNDSGYKFDLYYNFEYSHSTFIWSIRRIFSPQH